MLILHEKIYKHREQNQQSLKFIDCPQLLPNLRKLGNMWNKSKKKRKS